MKSMRLISAMVVVSLVALRAAGQSPTAPAPNHTPPTLEKQRSLEQPPTHPWMPRPTVAPAGATPHCGPWERDGYKSIQVNVDPKGCNILGDAANEPSIAVSATDPRKIVIGWRQFNSVLSDFREAGWAYSHDGGHTWVFRRALDPGVFGTDPVLASGPDGEIYYFTINWGEARLFKSFDGGITWAQRTRVDWGLLDKPWMAIDTTKGIGRGNIYIVCNCGNVLWRSTDGGITWGSFLRPNSPDWLTTIHVGHTGTVYVMAGALFSKSEDAKDPTSQPTWAVLDPDYGPWGVVLFGNWCGGVGCSGSPNPGGLLGQPWIVEGKSYGAAPTNVYVMTHAAFDATKSDPRDLMFVSSANGGFTWDRPHVVNDDLPRCSAWQWFGMMSVAPNGRIDVAWNDTRNNLESANFSELFYSFSLDGGTTWSTNAAVSPVFDSGIGYPQQAKLGDYYHMVSDNLGVNIAYAATFNGEQDIYFLRIGPWDCNANEVPDEDDIASQTSRDCNTNDVPDECEYRADYNGDGLTTLLDFAAFQKALAGPGIPIPNDCTRLFDPDHDGDVDLHDYYLLSHVFTGP